MSSHHGDPGGATRHDRVGHARERDGGPGGPGVVAGARGVGAAGVVGGSGVVEVAGVVGDAGAAAGRVLALLDAAAEAVELAAAELAHADAADAAAADAAEASGAAEAAEAAGVAGAAEAVGCGGGLDAGAGDGGAGDGAEGGGPGGGVGAGDPRVAMLEVVQRLVCLERRLAWQRLRWVAAVDEADAPRVAGVRSAARWLSERCGLTRAQASGWVRTAAALESLPGVAGMLAAGEVGEDHVHTAARVLREELDRRERGGAATTPTVGTRPDGDTDTVGTDGDTDTDGAEGEGAGEGVDWGRVVDERRAAHRHLAAQVDAVAAGAAGGDRAALRRAFDRWRADQRPRTRAEQEQRAFAGRRFWVADTADADGLVAFGGKADPLGAAYLRAAVDALANPRAHHHARHHGDDRQHAEHGEGPRGDDGAGEAPSPAPAAGAPRRRARADAARRRYDALVALAQLAMRADQLPRQARAAATVLLVATPEGLHGERDAQAGWLDGAGEISSETARLVCCDAEFAPVTVRNGEVLDAGRRRRDPSARQVDAVLARDQACVGCGARTAMCQIHHVSWWHRDHGRTDVDNLCLLCYECHWHVHHHGWHVTRTPDGRFTVDRGHATPGGRGSTPGSRGGTAGGRGHAPPGTGDPPPTGDDAPPSNGAPPGNGPPPAGDRARATDPVGDRSDDAAADAPDGASSNPPAKPPHTPIPDPPDPSPVHRQPAGALR